jgi:DNA polymerase elongation subunit (family B)
MTSWVGIRPLGRAFAATGRYPGTFPHDMDSLVKSINSGGSRGGTVEAFTDEARLLRRVFSLLLHHDPDVIVGHNIVGFDLDVLLASAKRQVLLCSVKCTYTQ